MPDYTVSLTRLQAIEARKALSFLNEDRSDATDRQIAEWLRECIAGRVALPRLSKADADARAKEMDKLKQEGWVAPDDIQRNRP